MRLACGAAVLMVMLIAAPAVAQSIREFDAASVKPNRSGGMSVPGGVGRNLLSGELIVTQQHIAFVNTDLRSVIEMAYGIGLTQRYALIGGPQNLLAERYDIAATVPGGATSAQVAEMLRSLLAERFKLRIHKETREMPVFVVTVARPGRLGPQLQPSAIDCATYRRPDANQPEVDEPLARDGQLLCRRSDSTAAGGITSGSASRVPNLLRRYQGFFDRPLVDATGLTSSFEWKLTFDPRSDAVNPTGPLIRDAFEDQLGLKLEARTSPIDVWVIDAAEAPTPD